MTLKLQKSQKLHNRIIQKQLQMRKIKKYLKKNMYVQAEEIQKIIDDLRLM